MSELTLYQLEVIDGEPRILDLTIAERLGFARPRAVRQLIERSAMELGSYGTIATRCGAYRNRPYTEYWLNEAQALLVCLLSRTDKAAEVRRSLITMFSAWPRSQLAAGGRPDALTRAQLHEINSEAWAIASQATRLFFQEHKTRLIKEARDRLVAVRPVEKLLDDNDPK